MWRLFDIITKRFTGDWYVKRTMGGHERSRSATCFFFTARDVERAVEYFKWCGQHQLVEEKIGFFQGEPTSGFVGHKRPMTISGLCVFLNISRETWYNYKKNAEYFDIVKSIDDVMFEQKFAGAAVGLFNANIIARDLGLTDKQEIKMDNAQVTPWSEIGEDEGDE